MLTVKTKKNKASSRFIIYKRNKMVYNIKRKNRTI